MSQNEVHQCACPCGASSFSVSAKPFARFYCHCLVCQQVYQKPFSDVTVLLWQELIGDQSLALNFKRYKPFPNVDRGTCPNCHAPVMAALGAGPAKLALISGGNYLDDSVLPEPSLHAFCHRKKVDISDDLPQYAGYLKSQAAVSALITKQLPGHLLSKFF